MRKILKFIKTFFIRILALIIGIYVIVASIPTSNSQILAGRHIILDPGHGIGMNMYKGYDEGVQMLYFSEILKPKLEQLGATVYVTRTDENVITLSKRISYANKISLEVLKKAKYNQINSLNYEDLNQVLDEIVEINRLIAIMDNLIDDETKLELIEVENEDGEIEKVTIADANDDIEYLGLAYTYYRLPYTNSDDRQVHEDIEKMFKLQEQDDVGSRMLFISLHTNATPLPIDESLNGITSYMVINDLSYNINYYNDYHYVDNNTLFSELVIDKVGDLGMQKLPIEINNFFVNRETNMPSVLTENGFHTNDTDRENLLDDDFLNDMADAYCDALLEYFSSDLVPKIPDYNQTFIEFLKKQRQLQ